MLDGPLTGGWELSLWHIVKKLDRVFSCNIQTRSRLKEFKAPVFNILWLLRSDFDMSFMSLKSLIKGSQKFDNSVITKFRVLFENCA